MNAPQASVLVCTRNRAELLAEVCETILAVDYPADAWELVIVDNHSTDGTAEVARSFVERHPGRARSVREARLGLAHARNRGIRETRGEVVIFVDDDAFPREGWLRSLIEALGGPGVLAAGGPVEPIFESERPAWLGERYLPYLSAWDLGSEPMDLRYNEVPRGANMAFRREVFERFGEFSVYLDRKGSSLLSCGDTELCLRIERGAGRIVYVPEAEVGHRVHAERITEDWMVQRFGAQGRSEAIVDWMHGGFAGLRWGCRRLWELVQEARGEPGEDGVLHRRCQMRAFNAYLWSAMECPLRIPRYRPGPEAGPVAEWARP